MELSKTVHRKLDEFDAAIKQYKAEMQAQLQRLVDARASNKLTNLVEQVEQVKDTGCLGIFAHTISSAIIIGNSLPSSSSSSFCVVPFT